MAGGTRARNFLERLRDGRELEFASRDEDKARRWCKLVGFAYFDRASWKWVLTPAGRAALDEQEQGQ